MRWQVTLERFIDLMKMLLQHCEQTEVGGLMRKVGSGTCAKCAERYSGICHCLTGNLDIEGRGIVARLVHVRTLEYRKIHSLPQSV